MVLLSEEVGELPTQQKNPNQTCSRLMNCHHLAKTLWGRTKDLYQEFCMSHPNALARWHPCDPRLLQGTTRYSQKYTCKKGVLLVIWGCCLWNVFLKIYHKYILSSVILPWTSKQIFWCSPGRSEENQSFKVSFKAPFLLWLQVSLLELA